MLSRPSIRKLLFFLSVFYSLQIQFVSEKSQLEVNLEEQTFAIHFQDLQIPQKDYDQALVGFAKMDTTPNRLAISDDFEFDTLRFYQSGQQLNADLKFHFIHSENIMKMFNIREDTAGNRVFAPLEREQIEGSNGRIKNTPQIPPTVYWERSYEKLEVTVKRLPRGNGSPLDSTRSLLPAWKQWKQE